MAIPTLPAQTGYTLTESVEHPNAYIGCYDSNTTDAYRLVSYNKGTLAELNNYDALYASAAYIPIMAVVDEDDALWVSHGGHGIVSYTIDVPGAFTLVQTLTEKTAYGYIHVTDSHLMTAAQVDGIVFYTKTGTGTINTTPSFSFSDANTWDEIFGTVAGNLLVCTSTANTERFYDLTTFVNLTRSHGGSSAVSTITMDWADDAHVSRTRLVNWSRNSNAGFNYVNGDTTIESIENWDKDITQNDWDSLVLAKTPFAWWKCNEAAGSTHLQDRSGSGYDMLLTGIVNLEDPALFNTHNNTANKAVDYAGGKAESIAGEDLDGRSEFSMEIWTKLNTTVTVEQHIFANGIAGVLGAWWSINTSTLGTLGFYYYNGAVQEVRSPIPAEVGRIYHIVATRSTTTGLKLYVDGVLVASDASKTGNSNGTPTSFFLSTIGTNTYDSTTDEAIIYPTELTPAEVRAHYEEGINRVDTYRQQVVALSPIGYWPCDEAGGTKIVDESGGTNHLTITGANITLGNVGLVDGDTCVYFSGATGQYANSPSLLYFDNVPATTVELWIQQAGNGSGPTFDIPITLYNSASYYLWIGYNHVANEFSASIRTSATIQTLTLHNNVSLNEWNHLVLTVDFTNNDFVFWLNGIHVGTVDITTSNIWVGNLNITLGNWDPTPITLPFKGYIQHVALYDFALSEAQAIANYEKGKPQTITGNNAYEDLVVADDPISYYPLDETSGGAIIDRMGREDLTIQGGKDAAAMTATGINGIAPAQPCLSFDGVVDYLIADVGIQNLGRYEKLSIEALVQRATTGTGLDQEIVGPVETGGYGLRLQTDDEPYFTVRANGVDYSTSESNNLTGSDETTHLAGVYDGRYLKTYVNGIFTSETDVGSINPIDYSAFLKFVVGASYGAAITLFHKGKIAHVAIHNKEISQTTLRKRYTTSAGYDTDSPNAYQTAVIANTPVAFYPLEENDAHPKNTAAYYHKSGWATGQAIPDLDMPVAGITKGQATIMPTGNGSISSNDADDSYLITNGGAAELAIIGDLTVEFWCNLSGVGSGQGTPRFQITYGGEGETEALNFTWLVEVLATGEMRFFWEHGAGINITLLTSPSGKFELNKLQHIVFTREIGSKVVQYFINGVRMHTETYAATNPTGGTSASNVLGIGYNAAWSGEVAKSSFGFEGNLQNVAVYDSVLPQADIAEHYVIGMGVEDGYIEQYLSSGVTRHWSFDEDDNITCNDLTKNDDGVYEGGIIVESTPLNIDSTYSLKCNGTTGQAISLGDIDSPLFNSGQLAFEAWMQTDTISGQHTLFVDGGNANGYEIGFYNNEFGIFLRSSSTLHKAVIPAARIPLNRPVHVITQITTSGLTLFINGRQVAQNIVTIGGYNGGSDAAIGAINFEDDSPANGVDGVTAHDFAWSGYIDSVSLYGFTLFDEAKAFDHYDAGMRGTNYDKVKWKLLPSFYVSYDEGLTA